MRKQWTSGVAQQWPIFIPPTRPSLSELAKIEKHLLALKKHSADFKMLILGSTPEYRDLGLTYNVDYVCADYNEENFRALGTQMHHRDSENCLVQVDWRRMNFDGEFNLILGDLATTVTPVKDHDLLLQTIAQSLKKNGLCILKTALRKNNKRMSHQDIFKLYRKERSYLNQFGAVWFEVMLADYDFKEDTMSCVKSYEELKKSFKRKIITKYEFEAFAQHWLSLGDFKMNIPLRTAFLAKARKYFTIAVDSGEDWYKEDISLLILKRKKLKPSPVLKHSIKPY